MKNQLVVQMENRVKYTGFEVYKGQSKIRGKKEFLTMLGRIYDAIQADPTLESRIFVTTSLEDQV